MNNNNNKETLWEQTKAFLEGSLYLGAIFILFVLGAILGAASCDPRNPTPMDTNYSRTK